MRVEAPLSPEERRRAFSEMEAWQDCRQGGPLRVVVGGGLGDSLMHTPFIRHFRRDSAVTHLRCVVPERAAPLFMHNPHLDELIPCPARELPLWAAEEEDGDVFAPYFQFARCEITAEGVTAEARRGWLKDDEHISLHIIRRTARRYGLTLDNWLPEIFVTSADEAAAEGLRTELQAGSGPVVLNTRSASRDKDYPDALWRQVADTLRPEMRLLEHSATGPFLNGVPALWPLPPLQVAAALFRLAACVVTSDSFAAHVAAAVGTPAVVLFGPTDPAAFGYPEHTQLTADHFGVCCDPGHGRCNEPCCPGRIPPAEVASAVIRTLRDGKPPMS